MGVKINALGVDGAVYQLTYRTHNWEIGAGLGFRFDEYHDSFNKTSTLKFWDVHGEIIRPLADKLGWTLGALYNQVAMSGAATSHRGPYWATSVYAGLNYQPVDHLVITAKLAPLTYRRSTGRDQHVTYVYVFQRYSMSIGYEF